MSEQASKIGMLVGVSERKYSAFTDTKTGEQVAGGSTWWIHLSEDFDSEPVAIKANQEFCDQARELGFGHHVEVVVSLFAKGNRIERKLLELTALVIDAEGNAEAVEMAGASSNGRGRKA